MKTAEKVKMICDSVLSPNKVFLVYEKYPYYIFNFILNYVKILGYSSTQVSVSKWIIEEAD